MRAPWNALSPDKTAGDITSPNAWGYLISCWDCHAQSTDSGIITKTVTAHGSAPLIGENVTTRGQIWTDGLTPAQNLCRACHFPASLTLAHPPSSATQDPGFRLGLDGSTTPMGWPMASKCHYCHLSSITKPDRPIPAQDFHGFDAFAASMGKLEAGDDMMWPVGTTESYKPYGFMRNVGTTGRWSMLPGRGAWMPKSAPGVDSSKFGGPNCGGEDISWSGYCGGPVGGYMHGNYYPGGVY
jgi:hypothetical protein